MGPLLDGMMLLRHCVTLGRRYFSVLRDFSGPLVISNGSCVAGWDRSGSSSWSDSRREVQATRLDTGIVTTSVTNGAGRYVFTSGHIGDRSVVPSQFLEHLSKGEV